MYCETQNTVNTRNLQEILLLCCKEKATLRAKSPSIFPTCLGRWKRRLLLAVSEKANKSVRKLNRKHQR